MRKLKLYNDQEQAIEKVMADEPVIGCSLCPLGARSANPCLPPVGDAGGALLVFGEPLKVDDALGRQMAAGGAYSQIRTMVERFYDGPVAVDYALKCRRVPGKKIPDRAIKACRSYSTHTFQEFKPKIVFLFGTTAFKVWLGRSPDPHSVRRGYTFVDNIPVFLFKEPALIVRNKFFRAQAEQDIRIICSMDTDKLERPPVEEVTNVIQTHTGAMRALHDAKLADWVAWDCETYGHLYDEDFRLLSVAIAFRGFTESYVWDEDALKDPALYGPLVDILTDPNIKLAGQNAKYDVKSCEWGFKNMHGLGIKVGPVTVDTQLMFKAINADCLARLEYQAELVGMGGHKEEAHDYVTKAASKMRAIGKKLEEKNRTEVLTPEEQYELKKSKSPKTYAFAAIPPDVNSRYNALDTVTTAKLGEKWEDRLAKDPSLAGVAKAWEKIIQPATEAFAQIEAWGMPVNKKRLRMAIKHFAERRDRAIRAIREMAGDDDFNPGSDKQLAALLFKKIGLPGFKKTKSGANSTDASTLNMLKDMHPVVPLVLEFRKVDKLLGTYGYGMRDAIRADGRIHPTFNLDGARSGRLSCNSPNLQNIPRAESPEGKLIKDIFEMPDGHLLVSADFSQLELRIAADLSGDEKMKQIFLDGVDYHQRTAELIAPLVWKITDPKMVHKKHRSAAKAFNFGILYGMSDKGIAERAGCTVAEAKAIRAAVFGNFPKLAAWIREREAVAKRTGYTYTYWDGEQARRRPLWDIGFSREGSDSLAWSVAKNGSFNTPVQGTASDYCLASVVMLTEWLQATRFPAKLVATVHDSVMFEVEEKYLEKLIVMIRSVMEGHKTLNGVPITIDVEVGRSWGSLNPWGPCEICGNLFWARTLVIEDKPQPVCSNKDCHTTYEAAKRLGNFQ